MSITSLRLNGAPTWAGPLSPLAARLMMNGDASLAPVRERHVDWLFAEALPLWWSLGADRLRGGFRDALEGDGRPARERSRLRVQARQVYVYATAATLGWRGPWRAAVEHGLDWIRTRHARPDGLHRTMTTRDGEALDETATLYDQAFVLLALASAVTVLTERAGELEEIGGILLARIRQHFGHRGGFREEDPARPHQANAQMHLFEAALAWTRASPDPAWAELADQVGTLCCTRFLDPETGALVEVYDEHWRPAAGDLAGLVEPGHQFEWAWLLQQWAWSKPDPDVVRAARRLFEVGERGVDPRRSVAQNLLGPDLSLRDGCARLWPQTERLKAAHLLAINTQDSGEAARLRGAAEDAAAGLASFFRSDTPGLWWDVLRPDGSFVDEPAPASSLYHITAAVAELGGVRFVNPPRS